MDLYPALRTLQHEPLAYDVLAGEGFLGAAALLLENRLREVSEHGARFVQRAAVGAYAGNLPDEADIAGAGPEVDRGKSDGLLLHGRLRAGYSVLDTHWRTLALLAVNERLRAVKLGKEQLYVRLRKAYVNLNRRGGRWRAFVQGDIPPTGDSACSCARADRDGAGARAPTGPVRAARGRDRPDAGARR